MLQVVTDNHPSNITTKNMLKENRPNIFWNSSAAYIIDHMLQRIGKLPKYKAVIEKSREATVFLYAHHNTLSLIHLFTTERSLFGRGLQDLSPPSLARATMFFLEKWDDNR